MAIAIQILLFVLTHLPELIKIVEAIIGFFKEHHQNPKMSVWVQDFARTFAEAKAQRSPRPLEEFFARLRKEVGEG
jgi:hypothetical protein